MKRPSDPKFPSFLPHITYLVHASVWTKVKRPPPKVARTYKNFDRAEFTKLRRLHGSICSVFDDPDDCYWAWSHILNNISQKAYTLQGQGKPAIVTLDYTTKQESDECTVRDPQLAAKRTGIQDLWLKYHTLRNRITHKLGLAQHEYYTDLFKEINDCKPSWQLVQNAAGSGSAQLTLQASEDRMAGLKLRTRIKRKFLKNISLPLGRSSPMNSHCSVKRIDLPMSLVSHQRL